MNTHSGILPRCFTSARVAIRLVALPVFISPGTQAVLLVDAPFNDTAGNLNGQGGSKINWRGTGRNNDCGRTRRFAQVLVEHNHFKNVNDPQERLIPKANTTDLGKLFQTNSAGAGRGPFAP